MTTIPKGAVVHIHPGDHFTIWLPDGTVLNVEQTADDFSIVRCNGNVAYCKPTSEVAKQIDGVFDPSVALEQTTGRN